MTMGTKNSTKDTADTAQGTIAAVITAPGTGAVGALRLSGPAAFRAAAAVFQSKKGRAVEALPSYSLTYGGVYIDGVFLDQALLLKMKAPHSFTGEDVAELQCHGGPVVMNRLMAALTSLPELPVRPAEPGEFSRRAFINGKLDLSQAEAVMELVSAGNTKAAFLAAGQLAGSLSRRINELGEGILTLLAEIEAEADFPDEEWGGPGGEKARCGKARLLFEETEELLAAADRGRLCREGIRVVFYGRPNAGKSSLLNGILREPRAIVTPEPGTTRDILEEHVLLKGIPLVLTDTAGVRETGSQAEQASVSRARDMAAKADLVLYVVDLQEGVTSEDEGLLNGLDPKKTMIVLNKSDLAKPGWAPPRTSAVGREKPVGNAETPETGGAVQDSEADDFADGQEPGETADLPAAFAGWAHCRLCALEPASIDILACRIRAFFDGGQAREEKEEILLNRRQNDALLKTRQALGAAAGAFAAGVPEDIAAIDLKLAWSYLGELTGESLQPALVEKIFSTFCLGK